MLTDFPQLQGLIRKDAACYMDDFAGHYRHLASSIGLLRQSPTARIDNLAPLMLFVAKTAHYYPQISADFPSVCYELLANEGFIEAVGSEVRQTLVQALMHMRSLKNKHVVATDKMLALFFKLFRIKDKPLRQLLLSSIVADISSANRHRRDNGLNRSLQNLMYSMMTANGETMVAEDESDSVAALKGLQVTIELYRRHIWNDARTVNIIALAAVQRRNAKLMHLALNFFLGKMPKLSVDGDADMARLGPDSLAGGKGDPAKLVKKRKEALLSCQVAGVTKGRKRRLKRLMAASRRATKADNPSDDEDDEQSPSGASLNVLQMLNDPQAFAERIHANVKRSNDTFDCKLLMLNVLSRVIGAHRLLLPDFYHVLQRYLQPNQRDVLQVLAFAAQASHEELPAMDVVNPIIRVIAHNFVADHNQSAVIAAGLNGIREICSRCPEAIGEDGTLLSELIEYASPRRNHDKGVMMAARSLIALYRERKPELLPRRERGKQVSEQMLQESRGRSCFNTEPSELDELDGGSELDGSELSDASEDEQSVEDGEESAEPTISACLPLAATKILSAEELRLVRKNELQAFTRTTRPAGASPVDPETIAGPHKPKSDYAARVASIVAGRSDRSDFGSRRRGNERSSVPNREQAKRSKPQAMMAHKTAVRQKAKRSAQQKLQVQLAHRKRQKLCK